MYVKIIAQKLMLPLLTKFILDIDVLAKHDWVAFY